MMLEEKYKNSAAFFYLVLMDFMIAAQFVLFAVFFKSSNAFVQSWFLRGYIIPFFLSFFLFGIFWAMFKGSGASQKMIGQGLAFFVLGNIFGFLSPQSDFFILGRILTGLAAGMIFWGQIGTLCRLESRKFMPFSFGMILSFGLGFFGGPWVIGFLSGPSLGQIEVSLVLGIAIAILTLLGTSRTQAEIENAMALSGIREKKTAMEIIREKFWIAFKFTVLFFIVAWLASQYFALEIAFLIAVGVTLLSMAHSRIFDSASDAFLDVEEDDEAEDKAKKTVAVILKRLFYTFLDYGLAAVSVALVVAAINFGFSFLATVAAMWLIIDLPTASILVGIYEKTGRDMTLGRSYRRMANSILAQSKMAGIVVFMYEITLASFWSGPDYTVIFFKDELKTKIRTIIAILAITIIHSVLWTSVYWYGYEDVTELFRRAFGQN